MNLPQHQVLLANIEQREEPPKQFTFDAVYGEDSITENIYTDSVFPLVESVSDVNSLRRERTHLFRYSKATMVLSSPTDKQGEHLDSSTSFTHCRRSFSCGKSFSMQGVNTPGSLQRGIIPRSFEVSDTLRLWSLTSLLISSVAHLRSVFRHCWHEISHSCLVSRDLQRKYSRSTRQRCQSNIGSESEIHLTSRHGHVFSRLGITW